MMRLASTSDQTGGLRHPASLRRQVRASEVPQDRSPSPRLLGMELHAAPSVRARRPRQTAVAMRRSTATASAVTRRGVRVREVDLRAVGDAVERSRRRRVESSEFHPTCGTLTAVGRQPHAAPANTPSPGTSGASSLPSNSHCMPETDAEQRHARARARRGSRRATHRRAARVAPKCPTPGTTMASRRAEVAPAIAACTSSAPCAAKRLAHRRQIAGAVVDERDPHDHSSPFVLGSMRASRRSFAHGDAQRAGERLEHRLDLVMARSAVQHLHVHVRPRALCEAFEEVAARARSADRRPARPAASGRPTAWTRPPRSIAATASVSSIGITK